MRQIRLATMAMGLALVVAACAAAAPESASPNGSPAPSPAVPSELASMPPPSPAPPSVAPSLGSPDGDAADAVRDAAIASLAAETVRLVVDVRSSDAAGAMPPVTGTGQVSFGDPSQFRFASPGMAGTMPGYEVIYDGAHLFSRGRDTPYLPPETWLTLDLKPGTVGHAALLRQYGDYSLVLVTPLGVTSAVPAGDEMIGDRSVRRYVAQVDIAAARPYVPEALLDAYESHVETFTAAGVPLTHEVEVWVDDEGQIARTRYVQELEGQGVPAVVITYDFDDYGAAMDVAPPADAEVLTIEEAQERRQAAETPQPS